MERSSSLTERLRQTIERRRGARYRGRGESLVLCDAQRRLDLRKQVFNGPFDLPVEDLLGQTLNRVLG
jgi:hypothetical protein